MPRRWQNGATDYFPAQTRQSASAAAEAVEAAAEQLEQHAAKGAAAAAAAAEQLQRGAACSSRQRATYTKAPRKLK